MLCTFPTCSELTGLLKITATYCHHIFSGVKLRPYGIKFHDFGDRLRYLRLMPVGRFAGNVSIIRLWSKSDVSKNVVLCPSTRLIPVQCSRHFLHLHHQISMSIRCLEDCLCRCRLMSARHFGHCPSNVGVLVCLDGRGWSSLHLDTFATYITWTSILQHKSVGWTTHSLNAHHCRVFYPRRRNRNLALQMY
jgi:hypothetical protein